jgi:hypothetical protein
VGTEWVRPAYNPVMQDAPALGHADYVTPMWCLTMLGSEHAARQDLAKAKSVTSKCTSICVTGATWGTQLGTSTAPLLLPRQCSGVLPSITWQILDIDRRCVCDPPGHPAWLWFAHGWCLVNMRAILISCTAFILQLRRRSTGKPGGLLAQSVQHCPGLVD